MIYEPVPTVVEDINETHAKRVYSAAANYNITHTTGVESNITGMNNSVEEVTSVTKESE